MNTPENRLCSVRTWMAENNIDAWIQPHEDCYLNEYTAPETEYLAWLTGFTGSAGVVIITKQDTYLLTDSRYTVQSRVQCPEPLFTHYALESGMEKWLQDFIKPEQSIAVDARLVSVKNFHAWQNVCLEQGCTLRAIIENPIDTLWFDKPVSQIQDALYLSHEYHGRASIDKRREIAEYITQEKADAVLFTKADSICWLLNIRGYDVPCVPVINSLALVFKNGSVAFFCADGKVNVAQLRAHAGQDVYWYDEAELTERLPQLLKAGESILFDSKVTTVAVQQHLESIGVIAIDAINPVELRKACKNPVELQGMRAAHERDAIAMCQFLAWVDKQRERQAKLDEAILADKLFELRQNLPLFQGLSFDTISALGPNAAMCHYHHAQAGARTLQAEDALYLVDSGGQYLDGTTDVTRTIQIGQPNAEHKKFFTLVLKGHIQLALQKFPVGTSGVTLDAFARGPLWRIGCDFGHGTGHGVGHFLNVHEGPQNISPRSKDTAFYAGMVVSNEPGYYRENEFGIRCENLMATVPVTHTTEKPMLCFEVLTLVPFDKRLIDTAYLHQEEIDWLNAYHEKIWQNLGSQLSNTDQTWLYNATRPLT